MGEAGQLPEWVELVPPGADVHAVDGRKFRNPNPERVVEAFRKYGLDLPVDYEHASERKAPDGDEAPAAGWITELKVRDGAIWGKVEWTPKGAASLTGREYRYISPAFLHTKAGEITELVSAGLTNKPALTQLAELARTQEGEFMDPELLKLLGLPADASKEQALAALAAQAKARVDADAALTTSKAEVATARAELARSATPDLNKFVPRADFDAALARAAKAEKEISDGQAASHKASVEAEVDAAVKAGKITPATKDFYVATCATTDGLKSFREFVKAAPVVGDVSKLEGEKAPKTDDAAKLTEAELAVASRCGLTPELYAAARKAELADAR